jgi:transcriptional regulator with XRE-family HTH domain
MTVAKPAGKRLRQWRRARDITQVALANMIGVWQGTLASWETGAKDPGGARRDRIEQLTAGEVPAKSWERA